MGDLGSIPGLGRSPGEGKGYPLQYSGEFHGLDSPWGRKESDRTERLSLHIKKQKDVQRREWTRIDPGSSESQKI